MFPLRRVGLLLLLLAGVLAAQDVRSLTILHTNDLHARLLPDEDQKGGFAHLATVIRRELEGCSACLLLNGVEFVNRFGYDASTLGNHEFDYGWELIPQDIRAARFPFITANVVDREGRLLAGRPYLL